MLAKKTASAKNQEEYSKLYEELAKQKAQYDKNNTLLDKIEYSAQQQDYESVQNGLEEYLNNANQTIDDSTSTLEGSVEKSEFPEFDTSYFEQDLPYNFKDSHTSFDDAHKETYLTDELMNNILGIQPASAEGASAEVVNNKGNIPNYSSNILNELKKLNAIKDKFIIDQATNIGRKTGGFASGSVKNSSELWQYASQNKIIDKENVQEFSSIDQISNPNLNKFIHNKVQQQLYE